MTQPTFARRLLASLSSALVTGVVVFLAVGLAYYVASGASVASLLGIVETFAPSAIVLIVVILGASLLGGTATWQAALGSGILSGIIAPYFGIVILLSLRGGEFTASSDLAFQDLLTINLVFFAVTVIAALTLTRRAYAWAF